VEVLNGGAKLLVVVDEHSIGARVVVEVSDGERMLILKYSSVNF